MRGKGLSVDTALLPNVSDAWAENASNFRRWVNNNLVGRRDRYGRYGPPAKEGKTKVWTDHNLTDTLIENHARSLLCIGLLPQDGNAARFLCADIDNHGDEDPAANLQAAFTIVERAEAFGFRPILENSDGRCGYHIWLVFKKPEPLELVHRLGEELMRDLPVKVEVFPKGDGKSKGDCPGGWVRLPGRHHTRIDHFSKIWGGNGWLEGHEAIDYILATVGSDLPLLEPKPEPEQEAEDEAEADVQFEKMTNLGWEGTLDDEADLKLARQALHYIPADDYERWIDIGFALHNRFGEDGYPLFIAWSATCPEKFDEGECKKHWQSFKEKKGGVKFGSLLHHAKERGWRQCFANFMWVSAKKRPIDITEMTADLQKRNGGWPKRVGKELFVQHGNEPRYLEDEAELFAWARRQGPVDWAGGGRFTSQSQFFRDARAYAERFDAVETLPHWPAIPGIFYMHGPIPAQGGRLEGLLDFFCPATDEDRELIRAKILTFFWGGAPGTRPVFLNTHADGEQGTGYGKTTQDSVLAGELVGGILELSPTEKVEKIKERLLSPEALQKRVVRLDNIGVMRFSWPDVEGLVTQPTISGRAMYIGESQRPNTLVWVMTLNGASLSRDMAQRAIVIKLKKPPFDPQWESKVRGYIRKYRPEILADIKHALETAPGMVAKTRWGAWEKAVLSATKLAEGAQTAIIERQGTVDEDESTRGGVAAFFADKVQAAGLAEFRVLIPSETAAEWISIVERRHIQTNVASGMLKSLGIKELSKSPSTAKRGWIWMGPDADPLAELKEYSPTKVV
jgi:hypothetical protein